MATAISAHLLLSRVDIISGQHLGKIAAKVYFDGNASTTTLTPPGSKSHIGWPPLTGEEARDLRFRTHHRTSPSHGELCVLLAESSHSLPVVSTPIVPSTKWPSSWSPGLAGRTHSHTDTMCSCLSSTLGASRLRCHMAQSLCLLRGRCWMLVVIPTEDNLTRH